MTREDAIQYVTQYAQTDEFPSVDSATVEKIVDRNQRAEVWQASTAYKVGQRVQPTSPNGHFYECVAAGDSHSEEPVWSTKVNSIWHETDSDLIWQECAIDVDGNLYNLRNAVHEAWMLKAAAAAKEFDVSVDQQSWKRSQIHDHCLQMAEKWQPYD